MADVLRATRAVPGFHAALHVLLHEASPALRAEQAKALSGYAPAWIDTIDELPEQPLFLIANEFFDALPAGVTLQEVWVLFPDPWPKKRHHKNRIMQADFLEELARRAGEGTRLYFLQTGWANDPDWDQGYAYFREEWLETSLPRLQYRVRAELTDLLGRPVRWHALNFDAPTEDIEVDLTLELPVPGQKFGRGRPGFGLARDGVSVNGSGQMVLTREDGYNLDPVTIPELSDTLLQSNAYAAAFARTFGR